MDWKKFIKLTPLSIALLYLLSGVLWILFSDRLIVILVEARHMRAVLQTIKGWTFIGINAIFFYWLMRLSIRSLRQSQKELYQSYSDLEATHEELIAVQEELRLQFVEIQEQAFYYRGLFEGISSGIVVHDRTGCLIYSNSSAVKLVGESSGTIYYVDKRKFTWSELVKYFLDEKNLHSTIEVEVNQPLQQKIWLLAYSDLIRNGQTNMDEVVTTLIDQTEEKKLRIAASILNEINQLVMKRVPIIEIEQTLSELLVKKFEFLLVWVGMKKEDGSVDFRAQAGIKGAECLGLRWDDSIYAEGAVGGAIRSGVPQVYTVGEHTDSLAWSDFFVKYDIQSVAAFPLIYEGEVFGVFVLASRFPKFFGARQTAAFEHFSLQLALAFTHAVDQERLERYRILAEQVDEAILFLQTDGQIFDANESALRMYGYTHEELLKSHIHDLRLPGERDQVKPLLQIVDRGARFECYHLQKDGRSFPVEVSSKAILFNGKSLILAIIRDVTERKKAEEKIWHQAHYDALTDLPNRVHFYKHLSQAMAHAKRKQGKCGVLFLDLDRFKLINDTLGHNSGDTLLIQVAQRLGQNLREGDVIGRQGGDEFLILLPEVEHEKEAAMVAQRILEVFREPFQLDAQEVFVSPSIGISLYPTDGEEIEVLIRQADAAMYHAKELGRDNYQFYTEDLNSKARERLDLENNLRKGLERKEFLFYYQPMVNLISGEITGVEALIRWNSPDKGLVSPGVFIPVAEETGLIVPIGERALRQACIQNVSWQKRGYPSRRIAVNISARQFRDPQFVDQIVEILEETGLDPQLLKLEITESIAMDQEEESIKQLRRMKELGVKIAIDDFGTGYSSLNSLRRLPIDILKIDQSFVREIGKDPNGEAIIRTIVQLAKDLRLTVIAEGVETMEQYHFLKEVKCDEMQGYLFSKPLPLEELEVLLLTHQLEQQSDSLVLENLS